MINKAMMIIAIAMLFGCDNGTPGKPGEAAGSMSIYKDDSHGVICYQAFNNYAAFDCVKISRGE